ncbi:MAG: hypothetical protein U0517_01690 [Candidatus Andersenbacteria bacterium]
MSDRARQAESFYQEARSLMSQANDKLTSLAVFVAGIGFTAAELFGIERLASFERYLLLAALLLNLISACLGVWVTLRVNDFLNSTGEVLSSSSPDSQLAQDFEPWQFKMQLATFVLGLIALIGLVSIRLVSAP